MKENTATASHSTSRKGHNSLVFYESMSFYLIQYDSAITGDNLPVVSCEPELLLRRSERRRGTHHLCCQLLIQKSKSSFLIWIDFFSGVFPGSATFVIDESNLSLACEQQNGKTRLFLPFSRGRRRESLLPSTTVGVQSSVATITKITQWTPSP
jgi:hypothetical protein